MPISKEVIWMAKDIQPVQAGSRLVLNQIGDYFGHDTDAPPVPSGTRWRGSQAGSCAKQIAYATMGHESSNPITPADHWRMGLGSIVHTHLTPAIERWVANDLDVVIHEEAETSIGEHGFGHIDMVIELPDHQAGPTNDGKKIVVELKTINGTGFKKSIQGEGPRHSAVLQGSLYAHALDADLLVVCYLAVELLSPGWADAKGFDNYGRFGAEWHYTPDQFVPLAKQEIERMEWITDTAHDGPGIDGVPRSFSGSDPDIPEGAEIVDPATGMWSHVIDNSLLAKGRAWQCNYCRYQDRCVDDHRRGF
jgi:hypothetical protein